MTRPWYAFYPADYASDTSHLSLAEHGAYRLLLDQYYIARKPLPALKQLLRICRAFAADEIEAVRAVLAEFFTETDQGFTHARANKELVKAADLSQKRSELGAIGGARSAANRKQLLEQTPKPASSISQPQSQTPPKAPKGAGALSSFETFWKEYPRTPNMSKAAALRAWQKQAANLPDQPELIAAVRKYKAFLAAETKKQGREYPAKHAQGWLNEQRWQGYETHEPTRAMHLPPSPPRWSVTAPGWASFFTTKLQPHEWLWFRDEDVRWEDGRLVVSTPFVRSELVRRFADRMEDHFADPIAITVEVHK